MSQADEVAVRSPDERFRADLEVEYDRLMTVVREALASTKKVWVEGGCARCGCPHKFQVEVPNVGDALKAADFLASRGIGRPGVVDVGDRQTVHSYVLEWVSPDDVETAA